MTIIPGSLATDDRGILRFINELDFSRVKRFYQVENNDACIIRAWHGHKVEEKYVWCSKGSAIIITIPLDAKPVNSYTYTKLTDLPGAEKAVLSAAQPKLLHIPAGVYNGFRTLEAGTILQFFSTATLEESKNDDFRVKYSTFGDGLFDVITR